MLCNTRAGLLGFLSRSVPQQASKSQGKSRTRLHKVINWLALLVRLLISSYNIYYPIILIYFSHMGSVPFSVWQLTCCLFGGLHRNGWESFCFQNIPGLFAPPLLPVWLFLPILPAWPISVLLKYDWHNTDNSPAPFPSFFFFKQRKIPIIHLLGMWA